jgi:hypothetical protein
LDLEEGKYQEDGENYFMRRFMISTLQLELLGWLIEAGHDLQET